MDKSVFEDYTLLLEERDQLLEYEDMVEDLSLKEKLRQLCDKINYKLFGG